MGNNLKSANTIPLKVLKNIIFENNICLLDIIEEKKIKVSFSDSSNIIELDEKLTVIGDVKKNQTSTGHVSESIDNKYKSISTVNEIGIYTSDWQLIHKIPNFPLKYVYFGTYCLFTNDSKYAIYVLNTENNKVALLQVFDIKACKVIYEMELDSYYCYFQLFRTPISDLVLIECSAGQDGTWIYMLKIDGSQSKINEWENDSNRIFGSFNRQGTEVLTVPHCGGDIIVHEFPSFKEVACISESEVFDYDNKAEDEDSFDFYGRFLGNDTIIFKSLLARLIAIDRKIMQVIGELRPPNYDNNGDGYITNFYCIGKDRLLVQHGSHTLTLYQIPINTIFSMQR